jgi:Cu(I)/Ag(I) efflux system periplasmic protein CusF
MKENMKHVSQLALALLVGIATAQPGMAQDAHKGHHGAAAPAAATATEMAAGEVKKIDKGAGKITIKHGRLYRLDMEPMTMVFRVADPKMLDQVQAGDKIRFDADKVKGALTVVKMEVVK